MSVKSASKPTSYETLRRNADDLRRVVKALVPNENKEGCIEMLYDVVRNWNLRAKRKDRKFEGEWLFRSHPQYIMEGVASHQSKSERSIRTLAETGLVVKRSAALGSNLKTIHIQPSPILEQILQAVSDAIDSLLGLIPVRKFLLPLLDWTKRGDKEPTSLHFVFRQFINDGVMDFDLMAKIMSDHITALKVEPLEDKAESKPKKEYGGIKVKSKMPGWDEESPEQKITKLEVITPLQNDKSDGQPGGQNDNFDGTLHSDKGTLFKGTLEKGTGLPPASNIPKYWPPKDDSYDWPPKSYESPDSPVSGSLGDHLFYVSDGQYQYEEQGFLVVFSNLTGTKVCKTLIPTMDMEDPKHPFTVGDAGKYAGIQGILLSGPSPKSPVMDLKTPVKLLLSELLKL